MLAPLAWLVDAPLPNLTAVQVSAYCYLSLVGALLAYALWFRGIARLQAVAVASLGLLSPLTAVILGWIVLGQSMNGTAMIGLALVLSSVVSVQWIANRPPPIAGRPK
jgi:probable blue pigment (indigoidine) exporter